MEVECGRRRARASSRREKKGEVNLERTRVVVALWSVKERNGRAVEGAPKGGRQDTVVARRWRVGVLSCRWWKEYNSRKRWMKTAVVRASSSPRRPSSSSARSLRTRAAKENSRDLVGGAYGRRKSTHDERRENVRRPRRRFCLVVVKSESSCFEEDGGAGAAARTVARPPPRLDGEWFLFCLRLMNSFAKAATCGVEPRYIDRYDLISDVSSRVMQNWISVKSSDPVIFFSCVLHHASRLVPVLVAPKGDAAFFVVGGASTACCGCGGPGAGPPRCRCAAARACCCCWIAWALCCCACSCGCSCCGGACGGRCGW
mmetsp:Transcript_8993/g.27581  ORF Transcript_8993/g.27581 Transcript_8993/m.27581 type:complete len:316 (-) Transcript_8993:338-1285(-)